MNNPGNYRQPLAVLVPFLLGCLFLVSAAFKTEQFVVETHLGEGILHSRILVALLIECELLLGIWLLSGMYPRHCRMVAIGVFCLFAVITFQKGLSGESSCGCFGRLQINPWWTLTIDLVAVASLVSWRPASDNSNGVTNRSRLAISLLAVLLFCGTSLTVIANSTPSQLAGDGTILGTGELVILEPEQWIDQPLPIAAHIDIGEQLLKGPWILVLFHHDCPKCQEALPKYEQLAQEMAQKGDSTRIAVIEVPPHGERSIPANHAAKNAYGRLTDKREWFVQAPVEIVVDDGVVRDVSLELLSLAMGGEL